MSSFQTISRINRITTYAEAVATYNNTKPIRGSDNVRPIGARRDGHRYHIKQNGTTYQAYLYNTPMVEFHESGEIVVKTYGFDTALTMDFISAVLWIPACRTRNQCVFTINDIKYVTSGQEGRLVLRPIGYRSYEVVEQQKHQQYVVNRKAANNVRRRYSDFRGYLNGFLSLRTQEITFNSPYRGLAAEVRELVEVSMAELVEHMGTVERDDHWGGASAKSKYINSNMIRYLTRINGDTYWVNNTVFHSITCNEQADDTKTANFYKACVILALATLDDGSNGSVIATREYIRVTPAAMLAKLDEIQFKWFSDEVFTVIDVPEGKVPNYKYNSWIR